MCECVREREGVQEADEDRESRSVSVSSRERERKRVKEYVSLNGTRRLGVGVCV